MTYKRKKSACLFFIVTIVFYFTSPGFPLEQDIGIVFGNSVRLRSGPGLTYGIAGKCNAGSIVVIIEKTSKREILDKHNDAYGYHWFKVRLSSGKTGWIYGRYMYPLSSKAFYKDKKTATEIQGKSLLLGKQYYFSIAKEPSFPVMTDQGLTGSTIHGLPFIYTKNSNKAILFWIDKDTPKEIIFREKKTGTHGSDY